MAIDINSEEGSQNRDKLESFLRSLGTNGSSSTDNDSRNMPKSSSVQHEFTSKDFGHSLFNRAPEDFFARTSSEDLGKILNRTKDFFASFCSSEAPFSIHIDSSPSFLSSKSTSTIFVALGDRPFIIDTITEVFTKLKIHHQVLLHPILRRANKQRISLSYIEIDKLESDDLANKLRYELESAFKELINITDDFTTTLFRLESISHAVKINPGIAEIS